MNKPITLCDRCDIAGSCLLNYDGTPCRKNRTAEPTNYDRIRAMTDEELARLLASNADCNECRIYSYKDGCMENYTTCVCQWLNWLKQEAEE